MSKPTARFWVHIHGPVRIKMNRGDVLHHHYAWNTDEGWSSEAHTWTFDGAKVKMNHHSDGVDCDGRLERFHTASCHVSGLKSGYHDLDHGVTYPDWATVRSSQRDHYAEAMGY